MKASSTIHAATLNFQHMHCWAPAAEGAAAWCRWLQKQSAPAGETPPDLADIPPMQRRRLSLLARCVFKVAGQCLQQVPPAQRQEIVCLFANAYGQTTTTAKMLHGLAVAQPTSPSAFSLSVHNAIAGQFSIAHGLTSPSSTLAPGTDGLGGVLLEAAGWLQDRRYQQVLLCCFEEPVPATMKPYQPNPPTPMAAAWLLQPTQAGTNLQLYRELPGEFATGAENAATFGTPFWQQILEFVAFVHQAEPGVAMHQQAGHGISYRYELAETVS